MRLKIFVLGFALTMSSIAFASKKECTEAPRDKWIKEEDFKKQLEQQGYKIRKFKQPGTCYEIYGTDKDGKKVEIYFDPVDGKIVKKESDE